MDPIGIPFILATGASKDINRTRVVEATITAAVVGVMTLTGGYYIALPVLQNEVAQMRREGLETRALIREVKAEMDGRTIRRDAREALTEAKIVQLQIEMAKRGGRM